MIERPTVRLDASGTEWKLPPWPLAFEIANLLPDSSWTLVGGLMVQVHSRIAGLPPSRATIDVDSLLHLETKVTTFNQVEYTMRKAGFSLNPDTKFAYQFKRVDDRVDVMCSDRYAEQHRPLFGQRPLFAVPAGTRALKDTINVKFLSQDVTISLPTVRGAFILKSAAYLDDHRDAERHLEDCVLLLACLRDPESIFEDLSPRSRKRIRAGIRALQQSRRPWINHDGQVQLLAKESLEIIAGASDAR
ncbi:hypothetical protein [Haematomicrobium sanguinis]|uniref:hypothetical protein n=1 Tax=Haematomicrobium sanguinis TaxID=479106 RepID=UPI000690F863|nr:hypothetical protein [Haematomicrobium sanguinis]